jgi:hypothetical protein
MAQDLPDGTTGTDIIAQTIVTLAIDIKTQTLAQLSVNILACTPTVNINILSQTASLDVDILACAPTLNINIASSAATINVNIASSAATINVSGIVAVSIGTVETLSNVIHVAGATDIDMGMPAINRPSFTTTDLTTIDQENPADESGIIDTVEIWAHTELIDCKVGMLHKTGKHKYRCRSVAFLGDVAPGSMQTFTGMDLDVRKGDYLGIYFREGTLDVSDYDPVSYPSGSDGISGDILTVGLETDGVDYFIGEAISLHAFATRYPILTQDMFSGKIYRNTDIASDDTARRFVTTERLLRDVIILVEDYTQLFGSAAAQTFPVVQGDSLRFTKIDISTLYFKNAVAGENGTVRILAVEE